MITTKIEPHHEKTRFCLCENKGADQLCSNCIADQRLCFRYADRTIPPGLRKLLARYSYQLANLYYDTLHPFPSRRMADVERSNGTPMEIFRLRSIRYKSQVGKQTKKCFGKIGCDTRKYIFN